MEGRSVQVVFLPAGFAEPDRGGEDAVIEFAALQVLFEVLEVLVELLTFAEVAFVDEDRVVFGAADLFAGRELDEGILVDGYEGDIEDGRENVAGLLTADAAFPLEAPGIVMKVGGNGGGRWLPRLLQSGLRRGGGGSWR